MTVIGYETDNAERLMAREIAALNMISCEFRGTADPAGIAALPEARLFLMVDIEGGEFEFCDPATIPRLRTATLLIEVHPATCENLRETLINRFAETHEYELVLGQPKRIDDWPELTGWPSKRANMAVTEGRPALPEWLLLKPR